MLIFKCYIKINMSATKEQLGYTQAFHEAKEANEFAVQSGVPESDVLDEHGIRKQSLYVAGTEASVHTKNAAITKYNDNQVEAGVSLPTGNYYATLLKHYPAGPVEIQRGGYTGSIEKPKNV